MKNKQFINDIYSTHKERIKANLEKFNSGKWDKYTYSAKYKCTLWTVENAINEVLRDELQKYKWENCTKGEPLFEHSFINIPDVKEIEPIRTIEHGDKIELIYSSKMNVDSN